MRVLITGANGYVATQAKAYFEANGIETILLPVRDNSWKDRSFRGFDILIHAAALVHGDFSSAEYQRVNVELTQELAVKARAEGIRHFLFMSSLSVYAQEYPRAFLSHPFLITQATPTAPQTLYGQSKLRAEQSLAALSRDDFDVLLIRSPMIYGKSCPGNYQTLRKIALHAPFLPAIQNERSMLFIGTLCKFLLACCQHATRGIVWPQDEAYVCTVNMMQQIALLNGKRKRPLSPFARRALALLPLASAAKAFGSLTIDHAASVMPFDYQTGDFSACMAQTEPQ